MANRVLHVRDGASDRVRQGIAAIQKDQGLSPDFPPEVEQAAVQAAKSPRLPEKDLTDLPFVTIDPASAMDLDQAMHLTRNADGYTVHYAIADVMAFVEPGDPIDAESHRRGETFYGADSKISLHPKPLSEGAASLLPDQIRPAFVWTIELDSAGKQTSVAVERARVRSMAKLDYEACQQQINAGKVEEWLQVLQEIGEKRLALEAERGGINLPMPEQQIDIAGDVWKLEFREVLPVENWNAQISLLTGMAAGQMMLDAKIGVLRTMPEPEEHAVRRLRRAARAQGVSWPDAVDYPAFIRNLDSSKPNEAAVIVASTVLLRGAGYTVLDGEVPAVTEQSALAAVYAHTTAPLRRLVDRYSLEVCAALSAGTEVPAWARSGLADLPKIMQESDRKANAYENAVLDLVEAFTLKDRVGETFKGVILEVDKDRHGKVTGTLMVEDAAIEADVTGAELPVGEEVSAELVEADPEKRTVRFEV